MDWKQVLPPLCRSRIETRFAQAGEALPAGSSKFGGRPDVPAGFVWPVFETKTFDDDTVKPRPLAFLAQFDCARLAELDPEGLLPRTGLLSFFYELGSQRWGYDPKDAGCARVFWFDGEPLVRRSFPGTWRRTSACRSWRRSCRAVRTRRTSRTPAWPWTTPSPPTTTASLTRPGGSWGTPIRTTAPSCWAGRTSFRTT